MHLISHHKKASTHDGRRRRRPARTYVRPLGQRIDQRRPADSGGEARCCAAVRRDKDEAAAARGFPAAVRLSIWHMPSATRSAAPPRLSVRQKAMCARTASSTPTGDGVRLPRPASYLTDSEQSPQSHRPPKYALTPPTYSPVHSSSPQHSQLTTADDDSTTSSMSVLAKLSTASSCTG